MFFSTLYIMPVVLIGDLGSDHRERKILRE